MTAAAREVSRQSLTPLGSLPRLQGDPRRCQFTTGDHALLNILVQSCEKTTGEVHATLRELASSCGWGCARTARRRLNHLDSLDILTYLPGRGRGIKSRVVLLFETWGLEKGTLGEKGASVSPFHPFADKERARVPDTPQPVQYPLTPQLNQSDSVRRDVDPLHELVRDFHASFDRDVGDQPAGWVESERWRAGRILEQFDEDERTRAMACVRTQYGNKPVKPWTIGLLYVFCRDLDSVEANHQQRAKRVEWHLSRRGGEVVDRDGFRERTRFDHWIEEDGHPRYEPLPDKVPPGVDPELWEAWCPVAANIQLRLRTNFESCGVLPALLPVMRDEKGWVLSAPDDALGAIARTMLGKRLDPVTGTYPGDAVIPMPAVMGAAA